jgi:hypothetical protein
MDENNRSDMKTERKTPGLGIRIALTLIILLLSAVVLYVSRFLVPDAGMNPS